jgi:hypothetical protein
MRRSATHSLCVHAPACRLSFDCTVPLRGPTRRPGCACTKVRRCARHPSSVAAACAKPSRSRPTAVSPSTSVDSQYGEPFRVLDCHKRRVVIERQLAVAGLMERRHVLRHEPAAFVASAGQRHRRATIVFVSGALGTGEPFGPAHRISMRRFRPFLLNEKTWSFGLRFTFAANGTPANWKKEV